MNVNGITSTQAASAYQSYSAGSKATTEAAATQSETSTVNDTGVIYERSTETTSTTKYTTDSALVQKLKADTEARTSQLQSIVEQMISKQTTAFGQATDIWKFLASGNYTVDASTKAQAQADIAEDGYWGVEATSNRIIDFATALTGGDPDKIEEMREAFQKGYDQAAKKWGGELPEISKQTYDAVMQKFDEMAAAAGIN